MITAALASVSAAMPPDTTISAGPIFQLALPYIVSGLGAIVTALIAWAAAAIQRWTGVRIDAAHREALHSAAMTGINLALSRLGASAGALTIDTKSPVIAETVKWMEKSVPGALAHFKMTPDKLGEFVEGKLSAVIAATPPKVAPPIAANA